MDGVDYTPGNKTSSRGYFIVEIKPETNEITGEFFDVYGSVEEVQTILNLFKAIFQPFLCLICNTKLLYNLKSCKRLKI